MSGSSEIGFGTEHDWYYIRYMLEMGSHILKIQLKCIFYVSFQQISQNWLKSTIFW